jgi:predicted glycoside hydrolase/deacetylase ChbG (UPF0249 family)
MQSPRTLAQLLGYPDDARLLIVNADDFGMCHAENVATVDGLESGAFSSATVMVPCPWFEEAVELAATLTAADIGVHVTHTSEWERYKWGPVCGRRDVSSMVTERGYLHADADSFYGQARLDEVERETRAQIDKALAAGVDVTHLDSHMGTLQLRPDYHMLYVQLASEYRLPLRTVGRRMLERMGMSHIVEAAARLGVLTPDYLWYGGPPAAETTESYWTDVLRNLHPGVTEIYIHAAVDAPELKAMTDAWAQRPADYRFFTSVATRRLLRELGIELIGYRAVRDLQHRLTPC